MLPLYVSNVPLTCINAAAHEYHVPARLIIAVLNVEHGKTGQASANLNGTYDLGPMQINSAWWPTLYRYHITPQMVRDDPCVNVKVGTWILGTEIAEGQNFIAGVGNYHSHTAEYNQRYAYQVQFAYTKLARKLAN